MTDEETNLTQLTNILGRLDAGIAQLNKNAGTSQKPGEHSGFSGASGLDPAAAAKHIKEMAQAEMRYARNIQERQQIQESANLALLGAKERERSTVKAGSEEYKELSKEINKLKGIYEKSAKANAKVNKQMEQGAGAAAQLQDRILGVSGQFQSFMSLFPHSITALKSFGKALLSPKALLGTLGGILLKVASNSLDFALAVDKAGSSFRFATGAGYGYEKIISRAGLAYITYGINAEDAGKAVTGLFGTFREFTELSDAQQGNLATTTAILSKFGLSAEAQGKILNTATKSLGMNVTESGRLLREFEAIARSVGKPISEIASDFGSAAPKIAFYGAQAVDVFKELEQQSKSTGLSVDKLLGTFGDQFDTFEGAGKAVGRLNALLGGPYLNSIDMLNASESERLEMLQDSMKASGTLFSDLNKFEQKAFASALGTDVDTLRKSMEELDPYQQLQVLRQEQLARKAGQARDIIQKLKDAFQSWIIANPKFLKSIVSLVDKFSDWTQKNHDLVKLWKTDIKPMFDKYAGRLILAAKLFGLWKLAMAGSWAISAVAGIMGITKSLGVLTLAQTRAAAATRMLGFAGAALGLGMATGMGVNHFRKEGNQGAAMATGVLGGAASGAAAGMYFGPWGALAGAVAGGIGGGLYAGRAENDVWASSEGPIGLNSSDKPFVADDGSVMGFGVQGGPMDLATRQDRRNTFAPRVTGAGNQNMSAMMPALVAAVREGVSSATVNANVAVQAGSGLKQGMFDFIDDANSPMNPFNQGSY